MSIILKLRMLSDEDEHFIRDYEVSYKSTLLDFHNFICDDIEYDAENISSFFLSNKRWEKLQEFTLIDMGVDESDGAPIPMESVTLEQLLHHNNDRLIYVFDAFEDRSMFIELMGAEKNKDEFSYPRVSFANGEAPDQFDAASSVNSKSIFDEAMDDYGEFEGDESYEDEY